MPRSVRPVRDFHKHLENYYCPSASTGFIFGKSKTMKLASAIEELRYWLNGAGNNCPVEVVWHNANLDQMVLSKMGIRVWEFTSNVYDTGAMFMQVFNLRQKRKLEKVCQQLHVQFNPRAFHNAGNDAAYTMMVFNALNGKALAN
jgi:DNA polymerase III epsilon subunit-like protein